MANQDGALSDRQALTDQWLDPENWPAPEWYLHIDGTTTKDRYAAFTAHLLRARYALLESNFRLGVQSFRSNVRSFELPIAERIPPLLHAARENLQKSTPDLMTAASDLNLAEQCMVWIYPPHVIKSWAPDVCDKVTNLDPPAASWLVDELRLLVNEPITSLDDDYRVFTRSRQVLEFGLRAYHENELSDEINDGLQVARLRLLRRGGVGILGLLLLAALPTANLKAVTGWPVSVLSDLPLALTAFLQAAAVALIGAAGGFLSGLLQVRDTWVNLRLFQQSMLKLSLKPLVGAIAALLLYILLSWQVLPGATLNNPGSYILIAFVAGFSERFFLRLLSLDNDGTLAGKRQDSNLPLPPPATGPRADQP